MGSFIGFFSNIFGYALNFIYEIIKNYGLAIILFSILLKIVLLPLSIKQQKTMKKTAKIQVKVKEIQAKYKGNQEKINQEMMDLYKKENMSPFSGCFSAIIQIVLLFAMFYLVRNPLTYMKKIDSETINNYTNEIRQEIGNQAISTTYPEVSVIKFVQDKNLTDSKFYINMSFLGLDLSNIPQENWKNWTVYIIPVLYVLSSIFSMKIATNTGATESKKEIIVGEKKENETPDMATQMNKNMMLIMPIMSVSISLIAPLGLALYWLINNILMIIEKLILNKMLISKEDETNG